MPPDLAFIDRATEHRFARLIVGQREEIGGILFYDYGRISGLQWARHKRLFGMKTVGLISHWLICPNTSNLRDRTYGVSDLRQLIGIAEQTADSLNCAFLHFHSHPNHSLTPSGNDLKFWRDHFNIYGEAKGVVVTESSHWQSGITLACHRAVDEKKYTAGKFLHWDYINHVIRRDEKERGVR